MLTRDRYIYQYVQLHEEKEYGNSAYLVQDFLQAFIDEIQPAEILDYGAGQSRLDNLMDLPEDTLFTRYDPAVPGIDTLPEGKFDLLICTDVLEHIPEKDIIDVLGFFADTAPYVFLNIALRKAGQKLPNGENAHCTVHPDKWWTDRLLGFFRDIVILDVEPGNYITYRLES